MAAKMFIFFILGTMLLILGYIMQIVEAGLGLWSATAYILGIAALLFYAVKNHSELCLLFSRRSARYGAVSVIFILAFVGILVVVVLFSQRRHYRLDLTKSKTHSIALQSRQQLERLERDSLDLNIYVFYRGNGELRSKQPLVDLLETYAYHSEHFKYQLVDIDRNPLMAMQLGITSTSTIILSYGERQEKIYSEQEAKITNAMAGLLGATSPGEKGAVYFVTGHGEPGLDYGESLNYSRAKEAIEEQIGPVRELLLATGKPVPDSCEILVVAGPEKDFLPGELEQIRQFLKTGGSALFLIEPFMAENLTGFLAEYGVVLGDDLIVDLLQGAVGTPFTFLANNYPAHDITRFFDVGTVFELVRSVSADSTAPENVTVEEFIKTSEKSHAEGDRELLQTRFDQVAQKALDEGREVPFAVAVTLEAEPAQQAGADSMAALSGSAVAGRLVVIGDRDFISDAYLGQLGNSDLLLNCLRWLRGQTDQITIAPKETENTPIILQRSDLLTMGLVTLVVIPVGIIIAGLFVWIRRRSKR